MSRRAVFVVNPASAWIGRGSVPETRTSAALICSIFGCSPSVPP